MSASVTMGEGKAEAKVGGKLYDRLVKLMIVGNSGVGKSCLLMRFCDDVFQGNFISTIGLDFRAKTLVIDGQRVLVQVWDSAGQERFGKIMPAYYRGAHGFMFVFDLADENSLLAVSGWAKQASDYVSTTTVPKLLAGNKVDLVDLPQSPQNVRSDAISLARDLDMEYIETSCKTGSNVQNAFLTLVRQVIRHQNQSSTTQTTQTTKKNVSLLQPPNDHTLNSTCAPCVK
jgi:small GTP-binding protein